MWCNVGKDDDEYDDEYAYDDDEDECPEHCIGTTEAENGPSSMSFAIWLHYAERKIDQTALDKMKRKKGFRNYITGKKVDSYFDYLQVARAREMGAIHFDTLRELKYIKEVRDEHLIRKIDSELGMSRSLGTCDKVIRTTEKCWNDYGPKKHYIFAIQESENISERDFEDIKSYLSTMLHYVLASGRDKVTILGWAGSKQKRYCTDHSNSYNIKEKCFDDMQRVHSGDADIGAALDYIRENELLETYVNN